MSTTDSTMKITDTVNLEGVPIFSTGIWEGSGSKKGLNNC